MHTKLERLLSKSLTTLEVVTHYLVVHTGPEPAVGKGLAIQRTKDGERIEEGDVHKNGRGRKRRGRKGMGGGGGEVEGGGGISTCDG